MVEDARSASTRRFLLIASLCLNLILFGLIVVGAGRVVQNRVVAQPGGPLAPGQIMRALSPNEAEKIRAIQRQGVPQAQRYGCPRARWRPRCFWA